MKRRFFPIRQMLLAGVLAGAVTLQAQESQPVKTAGFFSIGAAAGVSASRISATEDMEHYFAPTPEVHEYFAPAVKIEGDFHFNRFLGIGTGFYYQRRGQSSAESPVSFNYDPFVHQMSSRTTLVYFSLPVLLKVGGVFENQWFGLNAGPVLSVLTRHSVEWIVDDRVIDPYKPNAPRMPKDKLREGEVAVLLGLEYGIRFHDHGIFIAGDAEQGLTDIGPEQITGQAYNQSVTVTLGYRRFISLR